MSWALVAGASEGLGAAFAEGLAARGHDLVLLARREAVLAEVAAKVRSAHAREVVTLAVDLGADGLAARVTEVLQGRPLEVLVYNAAASPLGAFVGQPASASAHAVAVNCRAPVELLHAVLPGMVERKKGSVLLMSSLSAFQGTAYTAVYAATKAFNLSLAEALWAELKGSGVHVLACCAGATRTKSYLAAMPHGAPGELEPEEVVREALGAMGGGGPVLIPGVFNRVASFFMRRVLPRRVAVSLMASQTRKLRA